MLGLELLITLIYWYGYLYMPPNQVTYVPKAGTVMTTNCIFVLMILIHYGLVMPYGKIDLGQHWFRWWLVAYSAPSHYINQCWVIVNCTLRNKLQWNFNKNTELFIHKNASQNTVCKMAAILSRGRWVKFLSEIAVLPTWFHLLYSIGGSADIIETKYSRLLQGPCHF